MKVLIVSVAVLDVFQCRAARGALGSPFMIQAKIKQIGDGQLKQIDEALKEQSGIEIIYTSAYENNESKR
jgi:hypothetical protein